MKNVRIGVIGLGGMGSAHTSYLAAGQVDGATLGAICDIDAQKLETIGAKTPSTPRFASHKAMLESGAVDAVLIATPHYDHPPIALDAFAKGVHVLSEKPIGVSVNAARKLNESYLASYQHLKFGIMFNQRTKGMYQKLRDVITDGELGEITRVSWLVTDWFRTWTYYASGGWRATWAGEGGGVLINQCPHNMDLLQWITGLMPSRVTAVVSIGKTHPIEVEDEVSAILEYPNGAIGHFVTTTGEGAGTNRLEIAGERGKFIAEDNKLHFQRTRHNVRTFRETSKESFPWVEIWETNIPFNAGPADEHRTITQNFTNAIRLGTPLLSPGIEGIRGLEIGNAMLMAGITRKPVELPLDGPAYDELLLELGKKYGGKKTLKTTKDALVNMAASFAK